MRNRRALSSAALLTLTMCSLNGAQISAQTVTANPQEDLSLEQFRDPPPAARPRVWWHWMNGNITTDGIAKDLEWMKRIGIGGVQNFDVNISTPQIVEKRLVYMTPEWKQAFRFATEKASALGLEFAIAASPGWSETGGPWVKPEDGMKKIVWSDMEVSGGRPITSRLPALPITPGPYQDLPKSGQFGGNDKDVKNDIAGGDIRIFAYPLSAPIFAPVKISQGGVPFENATLLSDGKLDQRIRIATGTDGAPGMLDLSYDKPQAVRSAILFMPGQVFPFNDASLLPALEAKVDGSWKRLAELPLQTSATTVGFPGVKAREFRLVFNPNLRKNRASLVPRRHPKTANMAEFQLSGDTQIDQFEAKSGLAIEKDYYALGNALNPQENGIDPSRIVDLTGKLRADGLLDWSPPKGRWRVVRLGWSLTGTVNHPAPSEATGLEVDKYDGSAVQRYLEMYLGMYREAAGDAMFGKKGLTAFVNDSTEVGASNWTPRMVEQFKRLRGYDPTPWLPTLAGVPVSTRARSDGFLYDYRRTLSELHAEQHYGTIASVARKNGLTSYAEALEGRRPTLGDDMGMRRFSDIPMGAIWTYGEAGPSPNYLADIKGASSVAHIYGQNLAASESLTSNSQYWAHSPKELKPVIDLAFAHGINRPIIHTSVHQPVDDKVPGLSLSVFGQFFTRHESWAEMAGPWIGYISRSAYMLQHGRNVADVAYFYGEEAPLVELFGVAPVADAPRHHSYDFFNVDALLHKTSVENGDIVTKGGARYRLLYLGGSAARMTIPVLRKLLELVEAGATIVGKPPEASPSLADNETDFADLRARLWNGAPSNRVGKGRVIASGNVDAALAELAIVPSFRVSSADDRPNLLYVHRKSRKADIFFINNRAKIGGQMEARFRVFGKRPELWRAETGTFHALPYRTENGETIVLLRYDPEDAFFVVFRDEASENSLTLPPLAPAKELATLSSGWSVSFQPGRGGPAVPLKLDRLASLSTHHDPAVKYFSGVATYRTSFSLPLKHDRNVPLSLDLGEVSDLAEIYVNGQKAGDLWHAPWRLDIGQRVRRGKNSIEIRVANRWVNRLIGDAQKDATKIGWTAVRPYGPNSSLLPAGLIGPVRITGSLEQ